MPEIASSVQNKTLNSELLRQSRPFVNSFAIDGELELHLGRLLFVWHLIKTTIFRRYITHIYVRRVLHQIF